MSRGEFEAPSSSGDASTHDNSRAVRAVLSATAVTISVTLPVFLLGSHAAMVRRDLVFTEAGLGLTVACFFALSALTSIPAGRLSQRVGARALMLAGVLITAVSLGSVAALATSWAHLALGYTAAGIANGLAQPATNHLLAEGLRPNRRGIGLSIKQTAPMISSILAGVAVPLVGIPLGWRVAFGLAAVAPALLIAAVPPPTTVRRTGSARSRRGADRPVGRDRPLVMLALAGLLAAGSAGTLAAFLVESTVSRGIAPGPAALLLSAGGVISLTVRLTSGWLVDRFRLDPLVIVPAMLLLGSTGMLLLAFGSSYPTMLVATIISFGPGWGWPALLVLGAIASYERAPAEASGVLMAGVFTGGFLGPLVFGAIVTSTSYTTAWLTVFTQMLVAATMLLLVRRSLARRRREGIALP